MLREKLHRQCFGIVLLDNKNLKIDFCCCLKKEKKNEKKNEKRIFILLYHMVLVWYWYVDNSTDVVVATYRFDSCKQHGDVRCPVWLCY